MSTCYIRCIEASIDPFPLHSMSALMSSSVVDWAQSTNQLTPFDVVEATVAVMHLHMDTSG